jgi:hypothetical protein
LLINIHITLLSHHGVKTQHSNIHASLNLTESTKTIIKTSKRVLDALLDKLPTSKLVLEQIHSKIFILSKTLRYRRANAFVRTASDSFQSTYLNGHGGDVTMYWLKSILKDQSRALTQFSVVVGLVPEIAAQCLKDSLRTNSKVVKETVPILVEAISKEHKSLEDKLPTVHKDLMVLAVHYNIYRLKAMIHILRCLEHTSSTSSSSSSIQFEEAMLKHHHTYNGLFNASTDFIKTLATDILFPIKQKDLIKKIQEDGFPAVNESFLYQVLCLKTADQDEGVEVSSLIGLMNLTGGGGRVGGGANVVGGASGGSGSISSSSSSGSSSSGGQGGHVQVVVASAGGAAGGLGGFGTIVLEESLPPYTEEEWMY